MKLFFNRFSLGLVAVALLSAGCARKGMPWAAGGSVVREGFIDCFEPSLKANGQDVWCEASAVLYDGQKLILANDKNMPDARTSVFYLNYPLDSTQTPTYWPSARLKNAQKYEDFSIAPDQKHAFLLTAFDRIKTNNTEWDGFNTLIYWNIANSSQPRAAHLKAGETFSVSFREKISQTLRSDAFPAGTPYFKLEGLAATNTHLYFGVREEGRTYSDFVYEAKIIEVPYAFVQDSLAIGDDFQAVRAFNVAAMQPALIKPLGLSSIEYDATRDLFWVLTSYENKDQIGAYLWWATASEFRNGKLNLVNNRATGQPLYFSHKAEDLTILPDGRLFIIHDDDRVKTSIGSQTRQPHQTAYSIVKF